jgi:hypothetical protein
MIFYGLINLAKVLTMPPWRSVRSQLAERFVKMSANAAFAAH